MSQRPYFPIYWGDYKRSVVATCSPGARGLYLELKGIANDNMDRQGFLTIKGANGDSHNIPEPILAKRAGMAREEFDTFWLELRSVGVPALNSEGFLYFPEDVDRQALREKWKKDKKRQRRRKNVHRMSAECPLESENESSSVVSVVKTPAVKDNETTALVTGERRSDPVSRLVMAWKTGLLGIPKEDKVWNKRHWGRCASAAKDLLTICDGNIEEAAECMAQKHAEFTKAELNFTLETIVKHAHEWRHKNGLDSVPRPQ